MDELVMTILAMDVPMDSEEVMELLSESVAKIENAFDPQILDFDGNDYLNDSDLVFILLHWEMTANSSCYRNNSNLNARWRTRYQAYNPNT